MFVSALVAVSMEPLAATPELFPTYKLLTFAA